MMGDDTQPEPMPAVEAQAPKHPPTPERQQKASNVHDLADARFTRNMTPAIRKRVMARAKAIDQLLEGEDEDE